MSKEITKENAHKLGVPYYRTVQETCEETRRDENHSAFIKSKMDRAWNNGKKDEYKKLYKELSDYNLNISSNRRDIMIFKHDCKTWPDPAPIRGRNRSGELSIIHVDWPNFMPRTYSYEDSLIFTYSDERGKVLVRNSSFKLSDEIKD
tara:strand:+ start:284 stop:727 length:444 start_codon:yes stop_codon:yes gene_type:complete